MKRWLVLVLLFSCAKQEAPAPPPPPPSILLVTLDTTRADAIGAGTPSFNAIAARGRVFRYAYATVPQTLPSHASMMTGLYPGGHGVHENGRFLARQHPVIAERLRKKGYRTAAFVSSYSVARRFGLDRGFDVYDDDVDPKSSERSSSLTTARALAWLAQPSTKPAFLWVHYFDPHFPYEPSYPEEVAAMDRQLGRLVQAFEARPGAKAIVVVADHGESLGEHGEAQHGNLLYQPAMHVPLVIAGPGAAQGPVDAPVSTRRVFHTILDFAGLGSELSLRANVNEIVLGEAMAPFLEYGWQPQVMAVEANRKAILAGGVEVYDVVADPKEARELPADLSREMRQALRDYPIPNPAAPSPAPLDDEARKRLASLGYITADVKPVVREGAPRPREMAHLFDELDRASNLFMAEEYEASLPLLEQILAADPHNLMAALRLAAAHSALGHDADALKAFRRAESIAPDSQDVRVYLALHYARTGDFERAEPMLQRIVAEAPERVPPREALGRIAMSRGQTDPAIAHFEKARAMGAKVDLELGVLYLAARRYVEARDALDRAGDSPMALFKRAQVSVLLNEPDRAERIERARRGADEVTRELIAREMLFGPSP